MRGRWVGPVSALLAALAGCGGDDGAPPPPPVWVPTTVTTAGSGQTGFVGETLPIPISVLVLDQDGRPLPDVRVDFAVTAGGGAVGDPTTATDATGVAATTWTLGISVGTANNGVAATVEGYGGGAATFSASGAPGHAASIAIVSGNFQAGTAGTALSSPLIVGVRDAYGHPVPAATVLWAATSGGGSVSPISGPTGPDGTAGATRTLGPVIGPQTTQATVSGSPALWVSFDATALAAPPPGPTRSR